MEKDAIKILTHTTSIYKKCGLCGRPKDLPFKILIFSAKCKTRLQGEVDCCRQCADNISAILGVELPLEEVVKTFTFE